MPRPLSQAEIERRLAVVREGRAAGRSDASTALRLGMKPTTLRQWLSQFPDLRRRVVEGDVAPVAPPEPEPVAPVERHDSGFWRRKAALLQRERDELTRLVRELGTLDGLRIRAPVWMQAPPSDRKGAATLIVHNSDRHFGEVIRGEEINGWNAYDVATCERRVRRFMDAACQVGRRWTSDTKVDGVLYTMAGDEISGDIHDELRETNELTSLEQVQGAAALHVACIRLLADEYGRVHVPGVPGNHGRTTQKPTAKRYGALSYDIMIAKMVARELAADERISFDIAAGPDVHTLIYGRGVVITHGDKIGTGGGKGFAGPVLPIIRGTTQVKAQYAKALGTVPDLILMGHYHTSAAPPGILANGSVPGYSEFGFGIRGGFDVPRQWLAVMRQRWGLTERADIQLEDPQQQAKPRVRVKAGWAA